MLPDAPFDQAWQIEREVAHRLAERAGLRFTTADELLPQLELTAAAGVTRAFLDQHRALPVRVVDGALVVATARPVAAPDGLRLAARANTLTTVVVTPTDLRRLRLHRAVLASEGANGAAKPEGADLLAAATFDGPRTLVLFEEMLLDAIAERATDIHLEQLADRARVRFRIDGDLHEQHHFSLSPGQLKALVNVVKVRGQLDIAEQRLPQGGRFTISAGDRRFDVRVQTQPSYFAEHAMLRLLPREVQALALEDLGLTEGHRATYRRWLDAPNGLLLLVGPTGCGKSTTLAAGLSHLAADTRLKVLSIEDPVEYVIAGAQQSQVHPEQGFHFRDAMRAFVRQDPDVILLGELRDEETALEAIRASQTGHLVLTTVHTADSVDAAQRLFDLSVSPSSLASELLGVIAQRLVKRLCVSCRGGAGGCLECSGRGTFGRVAVVEVLPVTPAFRHALARKVPVDELREVALREGLVPMLRHGEALVAEGVIPASELAGLRFFGA